MGRQGAPGYSLCDKSRDLFIQVDSRKGTYTEVGRLLLQQMSAQMAGMMAAPPVAARYRLRVEPREWRIVAGVDCQAYALFDGTRKAADVCLAMAGNRVIPAADYATLTAMMDLMRAISRALPALHR